MESRDIETMTERQKKLTRFARILDVVSWLLLGYYLLMIAAEILNLFLTKDNYLVFTGYSPTDLAVQFLISISLKLVKGTVYWLALKGISLGLRVIAEIDFNQQMGCQGDHHE